MFAEGKCGVFSKQRAAGERKEAGGRQSKGDIQGIKRRSKQEWPVLGSTRKEREVVEDAMGMFVKRFSMYGGGKVTGEAPLMAYRWTE